MCTVSSEQHCYRTLLHVSSVPDLLCEASTSEHVCACDEIGTTFVPPSFMCAFMLVHEHVCAYKCVHICAHVS